MIMMVSLIYTELFFICVKLCSMQGYECMISGSVVRNNLENLTAEESYGDIVASRWTSPEKLSVLTQNEGSFVESTNKSFGKAPRVTGIAFDHRKGSLFVYMSKYRKISMVENFDGVFNDQQTFEAVREGVSNGFGSLAFDWLTENLYWTDSLHNWIAMQPAYSKDESMFKILVSDGLEQPEGLAIDPYARYIFWSDSSDRDKIERSSLSGSQRTLLIYQSVMRVFSLVADVDTKKLYWVDYSRQTLEYCDYNGKNRHIVRRTNGLYPTAVDVSSTHIFTVIRKGKVVMYNKKTEEYEKSFNVDKAHVIRLLNTTFHQRQLGLDRCETANCPHMCVNTANDTSLCVCKEGFQYFPSSNECRATTSFFSTGVVVTDGSRICMVTIHVISNGSSTHRCMFIGSSVVGTIAAQNDRIIYHEKTTGNLKFILMNGGSNTYLITRNVGSIAELQYDWEDEKFFWIDDMMSSIIMADASNPSERITIVNSLRDPQSMTIDFHTKFVFWSAYDNGGGSTRRIYRCSYSGSDVTTIASLTTDNLQGLYFDSTRDRLFWANQGLVRSVRTNGSDNDTFGTLNMESTHLLIYKDYAVWTNSSPVIFSKYLSSKIDATYTYTSTLSQMSSVTQMTMFDTSLWREKKGRCTVDNGGCEQICLPGNPSPTCKCELGFTIQKDNKSCSSGLPLKNFALLSDARNDVIYQLSLNGSVLKGIKIEGLDSPLTVEYHPGLEKLYSPEYSGQLKSANINGSDVSTIFVSGAAYPSDIGIDVTTNQIYFTMVTKNSSLTRSHVGVIRIDTSVHKTLVSGLGDPRSIAIHPEKGFVFWTDLGAFTHIGRSSMDGTGNTTIISSDITWPQGITIDYTASLLYWSDGYKNKVESCDFNGGNRRQILVDKAAYITDLIIRGSYVYYTSWNKRKITKADKKTGQFIPWMSDYPEFGRLDGIDFFPNDVKPGNSLCKLHNGDCSTFCLPTPRSRVCGCEDGVNLLSDRKRCENVDLCPKITIKNGALSPYCLRYTNQKCGFTCNTGFVPKGGSKFVSCGALGRWMEDMDTVCEDPKEAKRLQNIADGQEGNPSGNKGLLIGGSVGGGVVIIVIIIVAVLVIRRRSQRLPGPANVVYTERTNSVFRKSESSAYHQLNYM